MVALAAGLLAAGPADAAKRLVIGIDSYDHLPKLQKAVNDGRAVAAALTENGFDVVYGEDLSRREINAKLAELDAKVTPGDTVFFFFAGHGIAIGAENYLLPRDLPQPRDGEENLIRDEGHAVDSIIRRVQERGAAVSFFVLDACRDNPFAATGVRRAGASRGLAKIDTPKGVFVLFSAGIGQSALDRLGDNDPEPNSVFTRKLVPALRTPGLTQIALAKRVLREVDELAVTIRHPQQPAFYDQIIGEIELVPGSAGPAPQPQPAPPAAAQPDNAAEIAFWTSIQNSKEAAPFEAYLTQFPSGSFAALARLRLEQISATQAQAVARAEPAPPPPSPPRRPSSSAKRRGLRCGQPPLLCELGAAARAWKPLWRAKPDRRGERHGLGGGHWRTGHRRMVPDRVRRRAQVEGLVIKNGYQKSADIFGKNSRVKDIEIATSNGETISARLEDRQGEQHIELGKSIEAKWVQVIIRSVYPGWRYTDTAISGVRVDTR
jgi:hypothetical protein